jgi:histidinol-phosphate aminotransferase
LLYRTLAEIQGAAFQEVHYQRDWSLADDFCAPGDSLRLAYLANPNSPSGTMISPERVREIAERLSCPLLVDEAYVDFAAQNCLHLIAQTEKIMISRTLSKSYALAGLRFGFLVAQPHVIQQLNKVKDSYNCDRLAIAGAVAALDDQDWLRETVAKIVATREQVAVRASGLGFSVAPSQANFVWCTHAEKAAYPLYDRLKRFGILVRYMNYSGWGDGLRISVGTEDQMDACFTVLESLL